MEESWLLGLGRVEVVYQPNRMADELLARAFWLVTDSAGASKTEFDGVVEMDFELSSAQEVSR